jgi:DNA transformation protein and related proteins
MDAEGIREIFEPVGRVSLRRMFGGHGVYLDGLIIALESDGTVFLKTDAVNRDMFQRRGSRPFTYVKQGTEQMLTSYWSLPASAFDDLDELRELTLSSFEASIRAQAAKAVPKPRKITAASGSGRRAASRRAG